MEQPQVKVSFHIPLEAISKHISGAQRGLIATWACELPNFHSVEVFKTAVTVTVALGDGAKFTSEAEITEALKTLCELDPLPCPCGCGAFLVLHNCFKQTGEMGMGRLTHDEHEMIAASNVIGAIKNIRQRLGIGLKDAKDLADAHRESFFPGMDRGYPTQAASYRACKPAPAPHKPSEPIDPTDPTFWKSTH